jgi:hypothetical protein
VVGQATVNFERAVFSVGEVVFDFATFSGGLVSFDLAVFSGGEVSFSEPWDWSRPPTFGFAGAPPTGVTLASSNPPVVF